MKIILRLATIGICSFILLTFLIIQNSKSKQSLIHIHEERAGNSAILDAEKLKSENIVQKSLLKFHINQANDIVSRNYLLNDKDVNKEVESVVDSKNESRFTNLNDFSNDIGNIRSDITGFANYVDQNRLDRGNENDNRLKLTGLSNGDNMNRFDMTELANDNENDQNSKLAGLSNGVNEKLLDLIGSSHDDNENLFDLIRMTNNVTNILDSSKLHIDNKDNHLEDQVTGLSNNRYRNHIEELTNLMNRIKKLRDSKLGPSQEHDDNQNQFKKENYVDDLTYLANKDNGYFTNNNLTQISNNVSKYLQGISAQLNENENSTYLSNDKSNYLGEKMYPDLTNCSTMNVVPNFMERGRFMVLKNYIPAILKFECNESITLATYGKLDNLHNLIRITSRWKGPVSAAVYAPGTDFEKSIKIIFYLRNCVSDDVRNYVTFHIFFNSGHFPDSIPNSKELSQKEFDCDNESYPEVESSSYWIQKGLSYPVNVARNIARSNSATYFHFLSDIDMYPSVNIIPEFLKMLNLPDASKTKNPRVYVIPVFEVHKDQFVPSTKPELTSMLQEGNASVPHDFLCRTCQDIPKFMEWKTHPSLGLSVFSVEKRQDTNSDWEPFFIGTKNDPILDEQFTLEQRSSRVIQAYVMCLLDYEYHVLDNAFVIREKRIETFTSVANLQLDRRQNVPNFVKLLEEYKIRHGTKRECVEPIYY